MTKTLSLLAFVAALVVGAWGQQQSTKLKDDGKVHCIDLKGGSAKFVPCFLNSEEPSKDGNVWHPFDGSVESAFVYDLPAVKKTRKVLANKEECTLRNYGLATFDGPPMCTWKDETYYTCISPTIPPGLALVVSEDLTQGWCTGPRFQK